MKSLLFLGMGQLDSVAVLRARSLGTELHKLGWDVSLGLPGSKNSDLTEPENLLRDGLRILNFPTTVTGYSSAAVNAIQRLKPEYVHFLNASVKVFRTIRRLPFQKTIGDWEDWCRFRDRLSVLGVVHHYMDRWLLRRANIRLTCSRWLGDYIEKNFNLDTHYLPYACPPRFDVVRTHVFPEPTAVFMGSLWKARDHRMLLHAMLVLKSRGQPTRLQMIGSGEDLEFCRAFVRKHNLDTVELTGFLPESEMLSRLASAHVLIFPISSTMMNLARCPYKVFLYAQAGRPIITSAIGEVPLLLGNRGLYVDFTPEAYATAIYQAMRTERVPQIDYGLEHHQWSDRASILDRILVSDCQNSSRN